MSSLRRKSVKAATGISPANVALCAFLFRARAHPGSQVLAIAGLKLGIQLFGSQAVEMVPDLFTTGLVERRFTFECAQRGVAMHGGARTEMRD